MKKMATTQRLHRPLGDRAVRGHVGCRGALFGLLLVLSVLPCARADDVSTVAVSALVEEMSRAHPPLVLDVRSPEEYAEGHLPGALNIPHTKLEDELGRLEPYRDRDIVVYCKSGRRAGIALALLKSRGFSRLRHLEGDYTAWHAAGRPVEDEVIVPTVPH